MIPFDTNSSGAFDTIVGSFALRGPYQLIIALIGLVGIVR